jgi:hypothetical protein
MDTMIFAASVSGLILAGSAFRVQPGKQPATLPSRGYIEMTPKSYTNF